MRLNNMLLSKQFIFDWVFKCNRYLESTRHIAKLTEYHHGPKHKPSAKSIYDSCVTLIALLLLESHEALCLMVNSLDR